MQDFSVREVLPWDEADFLQMVAAFYASSACDHPIPNENATRTFAILQGGTPYVRCFFAVDEKDRPQGYCLCAVSWSNEAGGLCVWLEEIYIQPPYRGRGLGKGLIEAVQRAYPDAARLRLEYMPQNTEAARLYAALGFCPLGYLQMVKDRE